VLQERMIEGDKGSADSVVKFARSNRVTVVYNGVRVSVEHPVAIEHFRQFAVAVDALAVDMLRSAEVDVKAVLRRLTGGGVQFRSPAAVIGSALGVAEGVSSFFDAIVQRLRRLVEVSEEGMAVRVEAVSGVKKVERAPRVRVHAEGQRQERPMMCFCEERKEVTRMLSGECGGLAELEVEALTHYEKVLATRRCVSCESVEEVLARGLAEAEATEELGEEFFDCEEGKSEAASDSGYSSGSATAGSEASEAGEKCARVYEGCEEEPEGTVPMQRKEEERVLESLERFCGADDTAEAGVKTRMRQAAEEYVRVLRMQARAAEDDLRQKFVLATMAGGEEQKQLDAISDEYCWYSFVDVETDGRVVRAHRAEVSVDGFQRVYDYRAGKFFLLWYRVVMVSVGRSPGCPVGSARRGR